MFLGRSAGDEAALWKVRLEGRELVRAAQWSRAQREAATVHPMHEGLRQGEVPCRKAISHFRSAKRRSTT